MRPSVARNEFETNEEEHESERSSIEKVDREIRKMLSQNLINEKTPHEDL
jgi:hypothetical protein